MVGRDVPGARREAQPREPGRRRARARQALGRRRPRRRPPYKGVSLDVGPARSSRSRVSQGTASASWPRQSPAFERRRRDVSASTGALVRGDPRAAIAAGVAYVPEDRLGTGLAPNLSIASNFVLKSYRRAGGLVRPAAPAARDPRPCGRADPPSPDRRTRPASAGPAALGRKPPEGRARARVRRQPAPAPRSCADARARRRRDRDGSRVPARRGADWASRVLLISEDLDEILALADRIAVMYEGAILGEFDAAHRPTSRRSDC